MFLQILRSIPVISTKVMRVYKFTSPYFSITYSIENIKSVQNVFFGKTILYFSYSLVTYRMYVYNLSSKNVV
jgi:hypothetical protein